MLALIIIWVCIIFWICALVYSIHEKHTNVIQLEYEFAMIGVCIYALYLFSNQ